MTRTAAEYDLIWNFIDINWREPWGNKEVLVSRNGTTMFVPLADLTDDEYSLRLEYAKWRAVNRQGAAA